jgi:hypothetical protein
MYAIASLIVFVVSALAATYYKGRKNDIQESEKSANVIAQAELEEKNHAKK